MTKSIRIGWLDPSLGSRNLGDQIIAASVEPVVQTLAGVQASIVRLPTQSFWTRAQREIAKKCDHFFVGGTNLLNGNIPRYLQWKIDPDSFAILKGRTSLLGVGWWQYQDINRLSSTVWRRLLSGGAHSVRDEYTRSKLASIGVEATNTACPTMWELPDVLGFSATSTSVVTTITDYHADPGRDKGMLESLKDIYSDVYVWPQGSRDREYLRRLGGEFRLLDPSLDALNRALDRKGTDYFGTRLHAGIRAMQLGKRTTIVAVDNRAREIRKDTGLPVVEPPITQKVVLDSANVGRVTLRLPRVQIEQWKASANSLLSDLR